MGNGMLDVTPTVLLPTASYRFPTCSSLLNELTLLKQRSIYLLYVCHSCFETKFSMEMLIVPEKSFRRFPCIGSYKLNASIQTGFGVISGKIIICL
jgi:hypothetical protein